VYVANGIKVGFTGKERDAETGLDYFLARYYSSPQGRFTSADPVFISKQRVVDPQQWNLYLYARNNPLRFFDRTGRVLELTGDEERERALADIQRGVPAAQRAAVKAIEGNGENGLQKGHFSIDAQSLNAAKAGEDSNFHALRQIANGPGMVTAQVVSGATNISYVDNGKVVTTSFSALNAGLFTNSS
jgi:RHS repeat-associated protein